MGVDRVVAERPEEARGVEQQRRGRELAGRRRPADQSAPVEGDAEEGLRPPGDPLHQRVDHDQRQGRQREADREAVEGEQHERPDQRLQREEGQRLRHAEPAAGERSLAGALDPGVEVAVDQVVDHAAGAAHRHRAEREQRDEPEVGPAGGQRQRPPAGQKQQPAADRTVPARQHRIGLQPLRQVLDPAALAVHHERRSV